MTKVETEEIVTKDWVHVSPGLVSGSGGGCGRPMKLDIRFWLLGGSNAEKWGDHEKEKFFINNSVEAEISFE